MPIDGHFADLRPAAQAARPYPAIVPDAAAAAANRRAAADIHLCLDLQQHSATALSFLHEVHQHPRLAHPQFLAAAVRRYERCWLPLLAAHAAAHSHSHRSGENSNAGGSDATVAAAEAAGSKRSAVGEAAAAVTGSNYSGPLAAPLDVAWVWWAHAIAPAAYCQDLEAVLPPGSAAAVWSGDAPGSAPHVRPPEALAATQALWGAAFPEEPFHLLGLSLPCSGGTVRAVADGAGAAAAEPPCTGSNGISSGGSGGSGSAIGSMAEPRRDVGPQGEGRQDNRSNGERRSICTTTAAAAKAGAAGSTLHAHPSAPAAAAACSYSIVDAAVRQFDFYWSACLPHYREAWFLAAAVRRYRRFLHLHATARGQFLVPPYDVDLVWHTHMACSAAYYSDCDALFGVVFAHDDSVNDRAPGSKLNTNWAATQELYWAKFGEPLAAAGAMWRGPPPPAWAAGPAAEAPAASLAASGEEAAAEVAAEAAALERPRVYVLTDAATGGSLHPCISQGAAVSKDGWRAAVRASLVGGCLADDRLLVMQHWGPVSRAALVQVVTLDGVVEAQARLVGRESLPVQGDRDVQNCPLTPVLRYSPPGSKGPPSLDTLERAFSISSAYGDWGMAIARRAPAADAGAIPLAVDLYRLDARGGAMQAVWHMRAQHTAGAARLLFSPDGGAARCNGSAEGADRAAGASTADRSTANGSSGTVAPLPAAGVANSSSAAAAAACSGSAESKPPCIHPAEDSNSRPPAGAGRLRQALASVLRLGGSRKQPVTGGRVCGLARSAGDELARAQAAAAACDAARSVFADLDGSFRGIAIMPGGPAARPAHPAAQPAKPSGQPTFPAAEREPQDGELQNGHASQNGGLWREPSADAAAGSSAVEHAANGGPAPAAAKAHPAAAGQAAAQSAAAAAVAHDPAPQHLPAAVAVAAGEGAAEALALSGAMALQALMLEGLNGGDPSLFNEGLFAACAVRPGAGPRWQL